VKRTTVPLVLASLLLAAFAPPAGASGATDWPAYLFSARHTSKSASVAITPANTDSLRRVWSFTSSAPTEPGQPAGGFDASPIVYGGRVYIGSLNGIFYALNETTGTVAWSRMLGYVPAVTCDARGITSTATVAIDPATNLPTVYVGSGDGYLWALDAATGDVVWSTPVAVTTPGTNDYYQWSSPTVANGKVYIGFSSHCDEPLTRGGVRSYDQATGAGVATWYGVPQGEEGAGVWSSVAVTPTSVFVTTGNSYAPAQYAQNSIVRLDATTLVQKKIWTVPNAELIADPDFGGSPTPFTAGGTSMVGACNKNGIYYALRTSDLTQKWKYKVTNGTPYGQRTCIGAAAWDGTRLFVAASATTIGGTAYKGSIRRLDPLTGTPIWETGLGGGITGSPAMNGGGVISVPIWDTSGGPNAVYLIDAASGAVLRYFKKGRVFAQATFAGRYLFIASETGALTGYKVP
jgi:outer membrane protein assembly factor BamB